MSGRRVRIGFDAALGVIHRGSLSGKMSGPMSTHNSNLQGDSMSDVSIRVRDNGPLLVEGSFKLLDGEGNPLPVDSAKPAIALCRCGASANKPFCDGSHKVGDFNSETRATES